MDPITDQVRALYDRFPYPDGGDQVRADAFLDLLLSYVERPSRDASSSAPLHVLDAGCGTGAGIVTVARLHPHARCVGFDISASALERARTAVQAAGSENLELMVADAMDEDSLPRVDGAGYDVIYASGVVHHLSDPVRGLGNIGALLGDHGVMVLMVYSSWGRQPVFRFARAMDRIWPDRADLDTRVPLARMILESLGDAAVTAPPWHDAAHIPDNELVDRYLHVHDRGYTVGQLFDLIEGAGLRFLRWLEPRPWDVGLLLGENRARQVIGALPPRQRYEVLDLLYDHPSLTAVLGRADARPRDMLALNELPGATIAWNPQAALRSTARHLGGTTILDDVEVMVRLLAPYRLDGIHAALAQCCSRRMPARELVSAARALVDASADQAYTALAELLNREVLYVP